MTAREVCALLQSLQLPSDTTQSLAAQANLSQPGAQIVLTPPASVVLALQPAQRKQLYSILSFIEGNTQRHPYVLRKDVLADQLGSVSLNPHASRILDDLLYERERFMLFADLDVALANLPEHSDRLRLVRTVTRKPTWMVSLHVDETSDVNALIHYWGRGRRSKSLASLLQSASRVKGGCDIDLAHLLPPVPRRLLYCFPGIQSAQTPGERDCHWTTFNFFNEPEVDDYSQVQRWQQDLEKTHHHVTSRPEFGDVMLLATPTGGIIHSAVYLADEMVFTKNGYGPLQPWMTMKIDDLLAYYAVSIPPGQSISYRFFRLKETHSSSPQSTEIQ